MSRRILANKEEVNNSKPRQSFFTQVSNKSTPSNEDKASRKTETTSIKTEAASRGSFDTSLAKQLEKIKESFEKTLASQKKETSEAMKEMNKKMLGFQKDMEKRLSEDEQRTKYDLERVQKESVEEVSRFKNRMIAELDLIKKRVCKVEAATNAVPVLREGFEEAKEMIVGHSERLEHLELGAVARDAYSERLEHDQNKINDEVSEEINLIAEKVLVLWDELYKTPAEPKDEPSESFAEELEDDFEEELNEESEEKSEDEFEANLEEELKKEYEEKPEDVSEEESKEIEFLEQEESAVEPRLNIGYGPGDGSIVVSGGLYRGDRLIHAFTEEEVTDYWLKTNRNSRGVEIKLDDSNS